MESYNKEVSCFGAIIYESKKAELLHVIKQVAIKQITLKRASELMRLSKNQSIRIKKTYLADEVYGLISKKRRKPSPNNIPDNIKQNIMSISSKYKMSF